MSKKTSPVNTVHKGYNEKNPGDQQQGAYPPDGRDMPAPPPAEEDNHRPQPPVARKKKKRAEKQK